MASTSTIHNADYHELHVVAGEWSTTIIAFGDAPDRQRQIDLVSRELAEQRPKLVLLRTGDVALDAATLLLCLHLKVPVALIDGGLDSERFRSLLSIYQPDFVIGCTDIRAISSDYTGRNELLGVSCRQRSAARPHPDLAVLLATSGSTGNPKFVRLSHTNIQTNAKQIAATIHLESSDRAALTLPLHYSFGMSVVTSHVLAGATLVAPSEGVMSKAFWAQISSTLVTFMPGVPRSLATLQRLDFASLKPPSLRSLAQAGGKLPDAAIRYFSDVMSNAGGGFYVMYGQTEASPRISCLPPEALSLKFGSVGKAMPGGMIEIVDSDGNALTPFTVGEIRYTGPNVMMGYASALEDLASDDVQGDSLMTGDLGFVDDENYLFITGRSSRYCKIASARVSLDDVEAEADSHSECPVAALPWEPDGLTLAIEGAPETAHELQRAMARSLRVPPALIRCICVDKMPLLGNGKIDYVKLKQMIPNGTADSC